MLRNDDNAVNYREIPYILFISAKLFTLCDNSDVTQTENLERLKVFKYDSIINGNPVKKKQTV